LILRILSLLLAAAMLAGCSQSGAGTQLSPSPTEPSLLPPLPGTYAALGASETYGVGAVPHASGYAYRVANLLGATHFVDAGVPGTTIDAAYQGELTAALNARPTLCTVFFGVNDLRAGVSRQSFLLDLHDLVATLREARCRVLIVGLPDVSKLPAVTRQHISGVGGVVQSWNAGMRVIARQTQSHFLDLQPYGNEMASHPSLIAGDGLHPSTSGHARLAQIVLNAVRSWNMWTGK
jgi:acyl-CoA thioesterase I